MNKKKTIFKYMRPYRRRLALALAGTALFTMLSLLHPLLMRHLIDKVIQPANWNVLAPTVLAIMCAPMLAMAIRLVNMQLLMLAGRRFISDIRLALYRKILHLSMRFHGVNASGALCGRLMDDVNMLQRLLTENTVQILVDLIVFVFSFVILVRINGWIALFLALSLSFYVMTYHLFSRRIKRANKDYRGLYDRITGRLQETLTGVRQVRIYNQETAENNLFLRRTERSLDKLYESNMASVGLSTFCTAIAGFGSTLIAGLGAWFVLRGTMTYGDVYAVDHYIWMVIHPVIRMTTMAGELTQTFVSVDRVAEILNEDIEIHSAPGAPRIGHGRGAVHFNQVRFAYQSNKPLFEDLNLDIQPGMSVALAGHTGCGKTTITSLLMRYWDVQAGSILLDGRDIRDVDLHSLRQQFGVVLQHPVLFAGTLAENIAYGKPGATMDEIEEATRRAEVYEMAMDLPEGFDTMLGSEGVNLSLGEKQRISIARAILRNPTIFIMDEATSALDSESEALIQKALRRILAGRTSFLVAHRLSTIARANLIVVLDSGRIVETGTHEALLTRENGVYLEYCRHLRGESENTVQRDSTLVTM